MKLDQMKQAEALFMKTNLTKSEIAEITGVSRRTVHHWTASNNWDRLRKSAMHLPSMGVENLWLILTKVQEGILSPNKAFTPPTPEEIRMINHLGINIRRLTKRSPLNETIELRNHFMDYVSTQKPSLALEIQDLIDGFIKARAKVQPGDFMGDKLDSHGCIPLRPQDVTEAQLDLKDRMDWAAGPIITTDDNPNEDTDDNGDPIPPTAPDLTPSPYNEEDDRDEFDLEAFGASWVKPERDLTAEYFANIAEQEEKATQHAATLARHEAEEDKRLADELHTLQAQLRETPEFADDHNDTFRIEVEPQYETHTPVPTEAEGASGSCGICNPDPMAADLQSALPVSTTETKPVKPFMVTIKEPSYWTTHNEKTNKNLNRRRRREIERLQLKLSQKNKAA